MAYDDEYFDDEQDEDIDEEFDDEEDEEDDEDEVDESNEQDGQMSAQERAKFEMEEKFLKNKLKALFAKVSQSGKTSLNAAEKKDIKQAKAHPKLKNDINRINMVLASNKAKKAYKFISSSPALGYALMGVLILFLIIAVIAAIGSLMPWLFPEDESIGGGGGQVSAMFGIKGTDFYGARMVYADNEKAMRMIVEDYVEFVENGILEAEKITTVSAGGDNVSVDLTINIVLPSGSYDYSEFNETDFMSLYGDMYDVIYDIAKSVYKTDNGSDFAGTSLVQCIDGIKYFGIGETGDVVEIVKTAIINRTSFTKSNDPDNKLTQDDVHAAIQQRLDSYYSTVSTLRAEKLFVKDYILDGENMMENIAKENYVAMIFMPRKNLTFTKMTFAVGNADLTNFTIDINGETLTSDGINLGTVEKQTYIYGGNVNITANKFVDINESNLRALENEMSLMEIAKLSNYSTYLSDENDNGVSYLTIKKNGVVVNLFNDEAYSLVEFETLWR